MLINLDRVLEKYMEEIFLMKKNICDKQQGNSDQNFPLNDAARKNCYFVIFV